MKTKLNVSNVFESRKKLVNVFAKLRKSTD